jgi:hypothetical protein
LIDSGGCTSGSVLFLQEILARNASEASFIGGGMVLVTDPEAPQGQALWLPVGAYPENYNLPVKTQHREEFGFVIPSCRGMVAARTGAVAVVLERFLLGGERRQPSLKPADGDPPVSL